jgi:hypothetical protein
MATVLALIAVLQVAAVDAERASVPGPNGVSLDAALVLPEGTARTPSVVALHGCGGMFPAREPISMTWKSFILPSTDRYMVIGDIAMRLRSVTSLSV